MTMLKGYLTTAEAAKRLGISSARVRQFLAEGRIQAQKFGRDWAISEAAFAEFARHKRQAGNPNFRRSRRRHFYHL